MIRSFRFLQSKSLEVLSLSSLLRKTRVIAFHQSDNDISDNEKMTSFGGDFYHVLYLVRKGIAPAEVIKTAIQSCNESAKGVQGSGNLDEIKNKKTNQLLELEIGSAET